MIEPVLEPLRQIFADKSHIIIALQAMIFLPLLLLVCFSRRQERRLLAQLAAYSHQQELDRQQQLMRLQQEIIQQIAQGQLQSQALVGDHVARQMKEVREQLQASFTQHAGSLTSHLQSLTQEIRDHLQRLSQQVNQRLQEGFEKTSTTFTDVVKRLAIIDEAQKRITELSTHVVSLQDVLTDKRSRGAFGEVQLESLIANMIPANHYKMQHSLSNGKRVDCMLFLPQPTGDVAIDAKFPLETYQKIHNLTAGSAERKGLQQQFRQDMQKHIRDIAEKYILPPETSDGAVMFIPAEAIFSEIHAHYPELVSLAQRSRVWMVSPSTLMAVLTTARAVLKDDATRKQVHIIQQHLQSLAEDFQRFEKRMDKLSKHIDQAHQDVSDVNISAKKISQRFQRIEQVELDETLEEML
ncbi:MAG: DNA recombination protein RmuC [Legionellaceae bacterium]|nr:DNA recombination protein RmuC [Legionellaceae bacterium]